MVASRRATSIRTVVIRPGTLTGMTGRFVLYDVLDPTDLASGSVARSSAGLSASNPLAPRKPVQTFGQRQVPHYPRRGGITIESRQPRVNQKKDAHRKQEDKRA